MMDSKMGITGPINLGNPSEMTMLELAELVLELSDSRSKIQFYKQPVDDPLRRKPDISLAKDTLAWEPRTPLIDGLNETINYFKYLMR